MDELDLVFTTVAARSLPAGGSLFVHYDWARWEYYREFRLHIPVHTHPDVMFWCDGEYTHMAAGDLWAFDRWSMHTVFNNSAEPRVHLLLDTPGSDELRKLLSESGDGNGSKSKKQAPQSSKPGTGESGADSEGGRYWAGSKLNQNTLMKAVRALQARIRNARIVDESAARRFRDRLERFLSESETTHSAEQCKQLAEDCIRELLVVEQRAFQLWPRATTRLALLLGLGLIGTQSKQMFEPTSFLFRIAPTGDFGLWKDGSFHPTDFLALQLLGAFALRGDPESSFGAVGLEYASGQFLKLVQEGLLKPRARRDIAVSDAVGLDQDFIRQELTTPPDAFRRSLGNLYRRSATGVERVDGGEVPSLSMEDRFALPMPIYCRFGTEVKGVRLWCERTRDFLACRWEDIWILSMLGRGHSVSSVRERVGEPRMKDAIEAIRKMSSRCLIEKRVPRVSTS